jgi:ClpP class serine protease
LFVYYSGWLQKPELAHQHGFTGFDITDADKNGFMTAIHGMDRARGLDLILHTPGGDVAATESLVDYLRSMFGTDIRAIIPQIAMSGGTMIACACKEIMMGKQSSLGPIDPQYGGLPAHGIIEEFNQAVAEFQAYPATIPLWQAIVAKYHPTLIGECQKAIQWSEQMVEDWLVTGMFAGQRTARTKADRIVAELSSHAPTLSHNRHISLKQAKALGLKVTPLESNQALQEAVLTLHHTLIHTLTSTGAYKIIENQDGVAFIQIIQTIQIRA